MFEKLRKPGIRTIALQIKARIDSGELKRGYVAFEADLPSNLELAEVD